MRLAAGGLAAAIAATLAVAAGAARVATSGVYGTVTKSPTTPVCVEGGVCSGPAAHVTVQALRGARIVAHTVTDAQGRYRLALRPGDYRLRVASVFKPSSVGVVVGSGWLHKNLRVDTGIRAPSPGPTVS